MGGSRSKIRSLQAALLQVYEKEESNCEETERISLTDDKLWLMDEKARIDTCLSEVAEYFEVRKDDASSTLSTVAPWLDGQHRPEHMSEQIYENIRGGGASRRRPKFCCTPEY